ncbi:MAG TPA: hypothetical protein PK177_13980 [Burkholderiaceae bacterium]|nr:hypothetical protein [Burkholderiaceae bacterium]
MKRAYSPLSSTERRARALDEAFFDMPDTPLRSELVVHLRPPTTRIPAPLPCDQLSPRAVAWLAERGITQETQRCNTLS